MEADHESIAATQAIISVTFGLRGKRLDPDVASRVIGVQPSRVLRAGEEFSLRDGRTAKRPWTVWAIDSSPTVQSQDVNDHIDYMLSLLEGRRADLERMRKDADYCDVRLWYETGEPTASFRVDPHRFARLLSLAEDLNISVITSADDMLTGAGKGPAQHEPG